MQHKAIDLEKTGYFSKLMVDYVSENQVTKKYYKNFPRKDLFKNQIEDRIKNDVDRETLVAALMDQYDSIDKGEHGELVQQQITSLKSNNTFTITTGHQLCLFTGPLYFIYKIVNIINMANELKAAYPENHFVPIFWMATEDHDFDEVNHIHFKGRRMSWNYDAQGAVGRLPLKDLEIVIKELEMHLPKGNRADQILKLVRAAYLKHNNLAQATRFLVNTLFAEYGLVIIDGDHPSLKSTMIPYFKRELLEGLSEKSVTQSNHDLESDQYSIQVNPRDINLFYLKDDYRERITRVDDSFRTSDGLYQFTKDQILEELHNNPERFSPNVILRPLYQEVILPNLSYVGGGGELAYWMQLKKMFEDFNVPFPMLRLRNSVAYISRRIERKIEKSGIDYSDIFEPYDQLSKAWIKQECDIDDQIEPLREKWNSLLDEWNDVALEYDKGLHSAVEAQRSKVMKGLMNLERKILRSAKRKESDSLRMIKEMKDNLFPGNGLQERHDNFISLYLELGEEFIPQLIKNLDPFSNKFHLMIDGGETS